jgi:hypothetical protein
MNFAISIRSVSAIVGILFFVFSGTAAVAQTTAAKVAGIRKLIAEADRMAETAERDEYSSAFILELNVNPKENPYPAVGTYTSSAKFYYTYGDREKNPYPDKLVKIAITTRRSSTTERTEIYFRRPGEMIFYSTKIECDQPSDRSVYVLAGVAVRFEKQGKVVSIKGADAVGFLKEAFAAKARFEKIFQAAIR